MKSLRKLHILFFLICVVLAISSISCSSSDGSSHASQLQSAMNQGALYAATSKPGKVFRYAGETTWEPVSSELGASVSALVFYNGQLYAAANLGETSGPSIVYQYAGGTAWNQVSGKISSYITDMAVFQGNLYAAAISTEWGKGILYRFDGGSQWTVVADSASISDEWHGFRSLSATEDYLLIGASNTDFIARYDGLTFEQVEYYGGNGITGIEAAGDVVIAGSLDGWIYQTQDGSNFTQDHIGVYPAFIGSIKVFNNDLYIGLSAATDGSYAEQLYRWNGGSPQAVWGKSVSSYGDGINTMAVIEEGLVFGTGVSDPFSDQQSDGIVYVTDGASTTAISDRLANSITKLVIGQIIPPSMEITSAVAKTSPILPGGTTTAFVTMRNTGAVAVNITESGMKRIAGLPAGWNGEFIDVRANEYSNSDLAQSEQAIQPGGFATAVIAITTPCDVVEGTYTLTPNITFSVGGADVEFYPASDFTLMNIVVAGKLQGNDMATYRHSQAAIRQIRALDRNIESGVITTSLNLSYFGIDGIEKKLIVYSSGGYVYNNAFLYRYQGDEYQYSDYGKMTTAFTVAGKTDSIYESRTDDFYYQETINARAFFSFDLSSIPPGSSITNADLTFYPGSGTPWDGNFYVNVYPISQDPIAAEAEALYQDAGDGNAYLTSLVMVPDAPITVSLGALALSDFALSSGGKFTIGVTLDDAISSKDQYVDDNEYYYASNYASQISTSAGKNPSISTTAEQFPDPDTALRTILGVFYQGDSTRANEIAASINDQYYSIGYWDLGPGQDKCNEGNGGKP